MNGKFRVIPLGFNRRDVIEYVKTIVSEKSELVEENSRLENELELAKAEIEDLKERLAEALSSVSEICEVSAAGVDDAAETLNAVYDKLKASAQQIRSSVPVSKEHDHENI